MPGIGPDIHPTVPNLNVFRFTLTVSRFFGWQHRINMKAAPESGDQTRQPVSTGENRNATAVCGVIQYLNFRQVFDEDQKRDDPARKTLPVAGYGRDPIFNWFVFDAATLRAISGLFEKSHVWAGPREFQFRLRLRSQRRTARPSSWLRPESSADQRPRWFHLPGDRLCS